jgi:hypothetical protein
MPALSLAEFLQGAAAAAAALRLMAVGLVKAQSALLTFLVFNALGLSFLATLPLESHLYFWSFIAYSAIDWAVSLWAVREMFGLSLSQYPGIRTLARLTLYGAVCAGAVVSATAVALQPGRNGRTYFYYVQIADRSVVFSLAVVVLALIAFLSRYPLHLSRNTYISCSCFSAVLLCQAGGNLIDSFKTLLFSDSADMAEVLLCTAGFGVWAFLLRPAEEVSGARIGFDRPDENELLRQLDSMNRLLTRVGRR